MVDMSDLLTQTTHPAMVYSPANKNHEGDEKNADCTAFVIILDNRKPIAIKKGWIQKPILNQISKVFYSPKTDDSPSFDIPKTYNFNEDTASCYTGYVSKKFGNLMDEPKCAHFNSEKSIILFEMSCLVSHLVSLNN